jgi:putative DNA primase/helicase
MPKNNNDRPSREAIEAALTFIPPNDRPLWLKVGMALKVELGDAGFDLFDTWSQSAESYDVAAVKSVWKGFKLGGKISIGTLLFEAKQRGFNLKDHAPAAPITAEEAAKQKQERAQRLADDMAEIDRKQAQAASIAFKAWSDAKASGNSAYLEKKKVIAHGVRFAPSNGGDTLLIPLHDASGNLCNLQRIFPNGDKRFYTGGRMSGCFHVLGDVAVSEWLLIAEGYATGATLLEASGHAVAIAFSASNIKNVAKSMRERYPDKRILICADDDSQTEQKTGKNSGVIAATEAAKAVNGAWCKPLGLRGDGNDFNDLMHLSGIEEVKKQMAAATQLQTTPPAPNETLVNVPELHQINAQAVIVEPLKAVRTTPEKKAPEKPRQANSRKPAGDGQPLKPFFLNHENGSGVFFHGFHEETALPPLKICSSLEVIAKTRDSASSEWGFLLEFSDPDGNKKRWSMPAKMLSGDGTQYRADLLSMGLMIEPGLKTKNYLTTYIQTREVPERVRCVERIGWHDDVYVLPDRTIGQGSEQVLFQTTGGVVSQFKQRGTLVDWQTNVSVHCRGNSRLLFFVSAGFASTLLHHAKVQSFGLHLMGSSSTGKSTAMKVAASIFGGNDYAQSWHVTDNSLEATAQKHSDALLVLDELGQADPKMVGNIAYMLSNEKGKGRATQHATAKKIATWRLIFLSDGEISLEAKMAEAGKMTKGGQDVRLAHINADAGKGLGVFDTLHGFADGAAMSKHLVYMAQQYYGIAGLSFIEWLVDNVADLSHVLSGAINATTAKLCPPNAHGQVKRVADFFSLVAAGGELATGAGITGWADGEATEAAATCFNDWLSSRGTVGDVEHDRMLELLPNFIQVNGDSRFAWAHRAMDDHAPKTINQAGFKRMISKGGNPIKSNADWHKEYADTIHPDEREGSSIEYYLLPKVFKDEVCKGYDARLVAAKMAQLGVFEKDKDGKNSIIERFAGAKSRYYKISSEMLCSLPT